LKLAANCLQLDVGNSGTKWRLLEEGEVVARGIYKATDQPSRDALLQCTPALQQIWVSSVAGGETEQFLSDMLAQRWGVQAWFARSQASCCGLHNSYEEPARMGVDRWLAMLAAWQRLQGRACVVDAGSALTCDLVGADGQHEGGYIIPGATLMERALLLDTHGVRFAEEAKYSLAPGLSTAQAVRHGIALAQTGALALAVERAGIEPAQLLFCGGGGETLKRLFNRGGSYLPDLVFEGLEVAAAHCD
jgi:type III pantothenate kinase